MDSCFHGTMTALACLEIIEEGTCRNVCQRKRNKVLLLPRRVAPHNDACPALSDAAVRPFPMQTIPRSTALTITQYSTQRGKILKKYLILFHCDQQLVTGLSIRSMGKLHFVWDFVDNFCNIVVDNEYIFIWLTHRFRQHSPPRYLIGDGDLLLDISA